MKAGRIPVARAAARRDIRMTRGWGLALALLLALYLAGLVPGAVPSSSVLPQLCISALMAVAVWLPFASGQLSLAQGGFMATGAYLSAWLTVQQQWPFGAALFVGAGATAALGLLVSYPALRLRGVYLAIATLGLGEVIRICLLNLDATGGAFGFSGIPYHTRLWHLLLALGATACLLFLLMRGGFGRAVWAVRHDEIAAAALGIETTRIRVLTFTLGAFVAGLAGGLQAHYVRFIAPDNYGMAALTDWLVFVMLGGFETFIGAIAGAFLLGTLPELLRAFSDWRPLMNGVLLVGLLILRPRGFITRELLGWTFAPRSLHAAGNDLQPVSPALREPARHDIVRIEGVSKAFGGVTALVDVSMSVRRGAIHGLIGPNGAGKTTLFNAIAGFASIDAGRIFFDGAPIQGMRPQRIARVGIARTFQNIRLYRDMTVLENAMLGGYVRTKSSVVRCILSLDRAAEREVASRALQLLGLLGLEGRSADDAGSLSYGDQRRLEVARALAAEPELLILDEPAAGMNDAERTALAALLHRIRGEFGKTILLIEHDMDFVMGLCEEVTVLNFGHVVASGSPAEVQAHAAVIEAYLGAPAKVGA